MIGCSMFPGLVLIFFGVLLLLENLGVSDGLVGKYWPVVLVILGVASFVNIARFRNRISRFRRRWPPDVGEGP